MRLRAESKLRKMSEAVGRQLELSVLAQYLGHKFKDLSLLDQALRHSSFVHEQPETGPSNERLEFLGDAVLALTVSHLLLGAFPADSEGELSKRRSALVNTQQLAALARQMNLGVHLLLGRGEEQQGGREKTSLLADALEAVLAAVFLDGGLKAAKAFTKRWFADLLAAPEAVAWRDDKTALQEFTQAQVKKSPTYRLIEESGPDHARCFRVEVRLGRQVLGQGEGRTKKQAEQMAARLALAFLKEKPEQL